jgi:hypothetical protein
MWPSLPECTSGEDKDPLTVTALWPQGSVFLSTHLAPHRFLTKQVSLTWENEGGGHFHCWPGSLRACPVHLISQGGMALCPAGPSWSQTHQPSRLMCVGVYLAPPPPQFSRAFGLPCTEMPTSLTCQVNEGCHGLSFLPGSLGCVQEEATFSLFLVWRRRSWLSRVGQRCRERQSSPARS